MGGESEPAPGVQQSQECRRRGRGGVAVEGCIAECGVPRCGSLQHESLMMMVKAAVIITIMVSITIVMTIIITISTTTANMDTILTMCQEPF